MSNKTILCQMARLSSIIKELKEIRRKLTLVQYRTSYFVIAGDESNSIRSSIANNISSCLYIEQTLRAAVKGACKYLDGFDPNTMEPIDYISTHDINNGFVDICSKSGKKLIATINFNTGIISVEESKNQDS